MFQFNFNSGPYHLLEGMIFANPTAEMLKPPMLNKKMFWKPPFSAQTGSIYFYQFCCTISVKTFEWHMPKNPKKCEKIMIFQVETPEKSSSNQAQIYWEMPPFPG